MRNIEAKELIHLTHRHELRRGNAIGREGAGWMGIKRKKWDNCYSTISKLYLKKSYLVKENINFKTLKSMLKFFVVKSHCIQNLKVICKVK